MYLNQNQRFFIKVNNNPTLVNTYIIFKRKKVGYGMLAPNIKVIHRGANEIQ